MEDGYESVGKRRKNIDVAAGDTRKERNRPEFSLGDFFCIINK